MFDNQPLKIILNWDIDETHFISQIDEMIWRCQSEQKVITLPVLIQKGEAFAGQLAVLLSTVNCDHCDALCCYKELSNEQWGYGIGLIPSEIELFRSKGYGNLIKGQGECRYVDFPCPFYTKGSPGRHCLIYKERPLSCLMFPFQPGGFLGKDRYPALAINSACPEGIRLAKMIFVNTYRVKNTVLEMQKVGY